MARRDRLGAIILPSVWVARLWTSDGRLLDAAATGNDILSAGRRDAINMLIGFVSFGAFLWVELGASSQPTSPATMNGTQQPLLLSGTSTPYRAQATPSDLSLSVAIPGSAVTGSIREAALFPSRVGGDALFRVVFPSVLILSSTNTLTLSIQLSS